MRNVILVLLLLAVLSSLAALNGCALATYAEQRDVSTTTTTLPCEDPWDPIWHGACRKTLV